MTMPAAPHSRLLFLLPLFVSYGTTSADGAIVDPANPFFHQGPKPGDVIDWSLDVPSWWLQMKEDNLPVKTCAFLDKIPSSNESCPDTDIDVQPGHYYCVFGTETQPTWFCKCHRFEGTYAFTCGSSMSLDDSEILPVLSNSTAAPSEQQESQPPATNTEASQPSATTAVATNQPQIDGTGQVFNGDSDTTPGDTIDWSQQESLWWTNMKAGNSQLRKCFFLSEIPDTGQNCPGIEKHGDFYYCVFGTPDAPVWFCICIEHEGDYVFHCGFELMTADQIEQNSATPGGGVSSAPPSSGSGTVESSQPGTNGDPTPGDSSFTDEPPPDGPLNEPFADAPKDGPQPGDQIDHSLPEPDWFQNLKSHYGSREIRTCLFLTKVPKSGDECQAATRQLDHYYCVFGTEHEPTWYCLCIESAPKYLFHCDTQMRTVEEAMAQPIPAGDAATGQPVTSGGDDEKKGVSFAAMFFTTFFFVVLIVGAVLGTRQYVRRKTLQRQHSLEQEKENLQNQWRDVNLHDVSMSDLNLQEYLDREYPGMNNSLQQYLDREYPVPRRFPSLTLT